MNIYLIIEDGETFCIKAKTMHKAVNICETSYLEDRKDEDYNDEYNEQHERDYYHRKILKSCALISELRN
jgi:hypothetical protein